MSEHEATRTLVKSPPELWSECSDPESLSRHLSGPFGQIKITRVEPESPVAWEGESARGTVRIEPSGWGTRVTLTAAPQGVVPPGPEPSPPTPVPDPPAPAPPGPAPDPEPPEPAPTPRPPEQPPSPEPPEPLPDPTPEPPGEPLPPAATVKVSRLGWLKRFFLADPEEEIVSPPEPAQVAPDPTPEQPAESRDEPASELEIALTAALDSLGQAHHRPFSRA